VFKSQRDLLSVSCLPKSKRCPQSRMKVPVLVEVMKWILRFADLSLAEVGQHYGRVKHGSHSPDSIRPEWAWFFHVPWIPRSTDRQTMGSIVRRTKLHLSVAQGCLHSSYFFRKVKLATSPFRTPAVWSTCILAFMATEITESTLSKAMPQNCSLIHLQDLSALCWRIWPHWAFAWELNLKQELLDHSNQLRHLRSQSSNSRKVL
jgi:hypothetical protein